MEEEYQTRHAGQEAGMDRSGIQACNGASNIASWTAWAESVAKYGHRDGRWRVVLCQAISASRGVAMAGDWGADSWWFEPSLVEHED